MEKGCQRVGRRLEGKGKERYEKKGKEDSGIHVRQRNGQHSVRKECVFSVFFSPVFFYFV